MRLFSCSKIKFVKALLAWVEDKKYEIRTNTYELYTLNLHTHTIPFFTNYITKLNTVKSIEMNTSTSEAGGCHYAGIALYSSRTRTTRKYDLPAA